jgi:hypothetical protein
MPGTKGNKNAWQVSANPFRSRSTPKQSLDVRDLNAE